MAIHRDYLQGAIEALEELPLNEADFTTFYILLFLRLKHPINWLQKKIQSA
jgi:hypothetical protein